MLALFSNWNKICKLGVVDRANAGYPHAILLLLVLTDDQKLIACAHATGAALRRVTGAGSEPGLLWRMFQP